MEKIQLPGLLTFELLRFSFAARIHLSELPPELKEEKDLLEVEVQNQRKHNRLYYEDQFVKLFLTIKLNSLAKVSNYIPICDRHNLQALLKFINSGIPAVELSESDSGFMKQVLEKANAASFQNETIHQNFLEGNCLSTTILYSSTLEALKLLRLSELGCGLCFEVYDGRRNAFIPIVHQDKNHMGQLIFANHINKLVLFNNKTSHLGQVRSQEHTRVQDAYSLRCSPQVNGVAYEIVKECIQFLNCELDQLHLASIPIEQQWCPSTHSNQRCVQLFDFLAIALHQISSISYVRSQRILNELINKLPAQINQKIQSHKYLFSVLEVISSKFLENKNLCYPISADTTIRGNYQQDVQNSLSLMYKKYTIMWRNLKEILGAEVLFAVTALKELKQHYNELLTPELESIYADAAKKFQKIGSLPTSDIVDVLQSYSNSVESISSEDLLKELNNEQPQL